MSVKPYEIFHGLVLTKLLRSGRPTSLRLVETNTHEAWSTYILNDTVRLFVSYSAAPRSVSRPTLGVCWNFNFSTKQLAQLAPKDNGSPLFAALVCGWKEIYENDMQVCLLDEGQIRQVIDCSKPTDGVLVKCPEKSGRLRVIKDRTEKFLVPRCRINKLVIPGT
jgi:hypothetical protein